MRGRFGASMAEMAGVLDAVLDNPDIASRVMSDMPTAFLNRFIGALENALAGAGGLSLPAFPARDGDMPVTHGLMVQLLGTVKLEASRRQEAEAKRRRELN